MYVPLCQDGNGYVSTSELKFVMTRLNVFFSEDELQEVKELQHSLLFVIVMFRWSTRLILMVMLRSVLKSFMISCVRRPCK